MKKIILVFLLVIGSLITTQAQDYGVRMPTVAFLTTGHGVSNDGIPPQPYETFAYDSALHMAAIEDFNVVPYTSVLPKGLKYILWAEEAKIDPTKKDIYHGAVLEVIMAGGGAEYGVTLASSGNPAQAIGTGLGFTKKAKRVDGTIVGGYAVEYVELYDHHVTSDEVAAAGKAQLSKALDHELSIRGLTRDQPHTYLFDYVNLDGESAGSKHGYSLTALGFLQFTNAPLP